MEIGGRQPGDAHHCHAVVGVKLDDAVSIHLLNIQVRECLRKLAARLRGDVVRCLRGKSRCLCRDVAGVNLDDVLAPIVVDTKADPEMRLTVGSGFTNVRTVLGVPLLREGTPNGVLPRPRPHSTFPVASSSGTMPLGAGKLAKVDFRVVTPAMRALIAFLPRTRPGGYAATCGLNKVGQRR